MRGGDMQSRLKLGAFVCLALVGGLINNAAAADYKGYAISWFNVAQYLDAQGRDCPDGVNPNPREYYRRELQRLGYAPAEVDAYIKDFLNPKNIPVVMMRG